MTRHPQTVGFVREGEIIMQVYASGKGKYIRIEEDPSEMDSLHFTFTRETLREFLLWLLDNKPSAVTEICDINNLICSDFGLRSLVFDHTICTKGIFHQMIKTTEECCELGQALMKAHQLSQTSTPQILEEMGHVRLAMDCIISYYDTLPSVDSDISMGDIYRKMMQKRVEEWYSMVVCNGGV